MTEQLVQENPMRRIRIVKVTVNIGIGEPGERLNRAFSLLEELTQSKPVMTKAKRSIRDFGVRKGTSIGVKVTLRGKKGMEFLRRALEALGNKVKSSSFDDYGNFSFGIAEHTLLPGTRYDPEVGIFGMDIAVTMERPGYRVMRRRAKPSKIPRRHRVNREEAIEFFKKELGVEVS
ncbi:50S ribosomal protein L5 [Sulfodiicoccus acidiphilus]|uniref:Large ribosomal subunit protein uL5 n=1 Tax=Sulfodiicoccus acidiphilus TaxID=1670455 RepID=A0A348B155_9CREN|nr:50S ribosomal protein L5 [Sulfodiicoccus acidiphilus]BBD71907.1 50S ribosomal protein L5 [Sulfodiicoccus acidiphilus]GGT91363.1 50S ribosomal protein L5 [Sulfodiicoccus acidiphilus]